MADLVQQIAEVLRGELVVKDGEWAWRDAGLDYVDQLAERVVARLNLHEEWGTTWMGQGPAINRSRDDAEQAVAEFRSKFPDHDHHHVVVSRWVSGWVPTPTEEAQK